MRLLVDLNILLDVLLDRAGRETSAEIIRRCSGPDEGWIAWHTLATLAYFVAREDKKKVSAVVGGLLDWARISETGQAHAKLALQWDFKDFEDALQAAAATACKADFIITRNLKDFTKSPIPALSPEKYLGRHR
ncbi:PIN domain-containing protein [Luteolibacter ambystomatis]|uniref:PIN domain-containing protein n=1 Tax=Luteolibacter ambystomatis TaxID=2824561 RepID=A0A975G9D4_9BACT|nr:PIN domain-containing protein [Luteolibacter ambystomatis]QUE51408.1 PIN domain-containing protein [Luteolibacter ambystomatis]